MIMFYVNNATYSYNTKNTLNEMRKKNIYIAKRFRSG